MNPTIGRIVLYTSLGDKDGRFPPEAHPALITKVTPAGAVSLKIFYEDGEFTMRDVPFTEAHALSDAARGKWSWPPRV